MPKSVEKVCSAEGYNQLLVPGEPTNNALEWLISRVESRLPKTFKALDAAAMAPLTALASDIYVNLCQYCSFLKLSSLFAKASAVVSFVHTNSTWNCDRIGISSGASWRFRAP